MFGRRSREQPPAEDAAVGPVEEILRAAAERHPATASAVNGRAQAARALWICACVSFDDAPTWLIYEDAVGGIGWRRITETRRPSEVVDAPLNAGGHADPGMVLRWLNGERRDPWGNGGSGYDDGEVLDALAAKLAAR